MKTGSAFLRVLLLGGIVVSIGVACRLVHQEDRKFGVIEGVLTDSVSGAPIFGASVMVKGSRLGSTTDTKGHFAVGKIPFGQYTIVVSSIEYQTREFSPVNVFDNTPVTLSANSVPKQVSLETTITVSTDDFDRWSSEAGTIEGKVVDSLTGEPLIGASVFVSGTKLGTTTDVEGKFSIWGVTPGVCTLAVTMIGYNGTKLIDSVNVRANKRTKIRIKLGTRRKSFERLHHNDDTSSRYWPKS